MAVALLLAAYSIKTHATDQANVTTTAFAGQQQNERMSATLINSFSRMNLCFQEATHQHDGSLITLTYNCTTILMPLIFHFFLT